MSSKRVFAVVRTIGQYSDVLVFLVGVFSSRRQADMAEAEDKKRVAEWVDILHHAADEPDFRVADEKEHAIAVEAGLGPSDYYLSAHSFDNAEWSVSEIQEDYVGSIKVW